MFITYEGIEGSGKSTQAHLLATHLQNSGIPNLVTREPGGCQLGRRLRAMLLDCRQTRLTPNAELCLFIADRAQHLAEVILPALEAGQTVICDRYLDSTIAYQGYGRGMNIDNLYELNRIGAGTLEPDLTILLDLPASTGLLRAGERNRQEGTLVSEGRFDCESLDFHRRVRKGYLTLAQKFPERIAVIDANKSPDETFDLCLKALGNPSSWN